MVCQQLLVYTIHIEAQMSVTHTDYGTVACVSYVISLWVLQGMHAQASKPANKQVSEQASKQQLLDQTINGALDGVD